MMITTAVKATMLTNSVRQLRAALLVICCSFTLLISAGCVSSSTTIIEAESVTNFKPMYSYTSLIIKDFELNRGMYADVPEAGMSQRELRYSKLPGELAGHIERHLKSQSIYSKISRDGKADASTLLLTGTFIRLGRFKISVQVILRDGATGQKVASFRPTLWDVLDTTATVSDLGREVADFLYRIQYK